jgi:hypothetical protein
MHPDAVEVIRERELRSQHKYLTKWNQYDQADEDAWTVHDRDNHGMPYAICTVCEYKAADRR